ncbi:MmcQ/YjbR family DNA-binding protein [Enterococcus mundtii]|uniref:MmcQ family protein n=1 Tax=Enterococcus mundtii TaxID=53346 RepID=A0A2T5DFW1_ENTMU|nr:MmcQ/YjbR family DNA-binding protein [Enterococcus mundtii]MBE6171512.1 MmcQ/YjbR family DNA-binding protein [Enterococcus faecium]PQC29011.1 MmcQ family protein [Enterococcus mundtii]PTO37165.1 MmcQ family protein [Enterococcus mundtii]
MDLTDKLVDFAATLEAVQIDHPFGKFPDYIVFRHQSTGKWFGLIVSVEKDKLGIEGEGQVPLVNVKADPEIISILKKSKGYYPAYHMNKNHWISVALNGAVAEKQLFYLLKESYDLTNG